MSEKRRPPSLRPGPALPEREPIPNPGDRRVVFYFDTGGDVGVTVPESEIAPLTEAVARAWNGLEPQTFTFTDDHGRPTIMVHLGKLRAVEVR